MKFSYNGREYVNFDLNDTDTVKKLVEDGIPEEFIKSLKNSRTITAEERLEALESAILALMDLPKN